MKALITGGSGFIGSHLTEALLGRGDEVIVLDDLSTGRIENLAHLDPAIGPRPTAVGPLLQRAGGRDVAPRGASALLPRAEPVGLHGNPRLKIVIGTILNERLVDKLAEEADVIFHLAAAVGVKLIVSKPFESLTTNIRGSEIVLEMAHRYRRKVLITSTSEIYGKNASGPLDEEQDRILGSPLKTRWSYSTAKSVDEILAHLYWKERNLPTIIVRLFNTVGPRQTGFYGMVIPQFVAQALKHEPITVYGTGRQTRCFMHVADCVQGLLTLMGHARAVGEVFNIGNGEEEITIEGLAKRIVQLTKSRSEIVYVPYEQAYEEGFEDMQRRVPDTAKIERLCGFRVTRSLDQILQDVIADCRGRLSASKPSTSKE